MKPVIDLEKEYALMLDGGGARGAYQIGAWKALKEVGVKIHACLLYTSPSPRDRG